MATDRWLPTGFVVGNGVKVQSCLTEGPGYQLYSLSPNGTLLVTTDELAARWERAGLLPEGALPRLSFLKSEFAMLSSGSEHMLSPVDRAPGPGSKAEAVAFATALRETRKCEPSATLHDAIYVERYSRLLPVWSPSPAIADDVVLGAWLVGGVRVSALAPRRVEALAPSIDIKSLQEIVGAAGLRLESGVMDGTRAGASDSSAPKPAFALPGRQRLEGFFREHVIDIVEHGDRYKALGIDFPSAMILHGPPGCGKTFAVERLLEHLGWPAHWIDSSSIGSPYIHDTGRKIAQEFEKALESTPSAIVIDEMESFLSDRQLGGAQGLHHVEEVAEFLRRIPDAVRNHVLVIGMTNRIDMIDDAILRRGRFDHVIAVEMPTSDEVSALLTSLLSRIPHAEELDTEDLVSALAGRPLSDAAFVIREGARLAARAGRNALDTDSLHAAMTRLSATGRATPEERPIGFQVKNGPAR